MAIVAINPASGETVQEYEEMSAAEAADAVEKSHAAYLEWKRLSYAQRAVPVREMARVLRADADEHARLITLEMGKAISEARAEIEKCAWACEYYAEHAERILADELVQTEAQKSYIAHRPLGVVLAVMPWNFPFWQVLRFAAPAVMAGNGGVLKHASNVPGSALAIEQVFRQAGFPEHLFRTLLISSGQVAEIIKNPRVQAVTLTGSTPAASPGGCRLSLGIGRRCPETRPDSRRARQGRRSRKRYWSWVAAIPISFSKTPICRRRRLPAWRGAWATRGRVVWRPSALLSSSRCARNSKRW